MPLLVPGRGGQRDQHRRLAQRGQLGDRARPAARDNHVRQRQHVGQLRPDEPGHQVAARQGGRQPAGRLARRLHRAGPALVDHVRPLQQPRQDARDRAVDLSCPLRAAGHVHDRQAGGHPGPAERGGGLASVSGQYPGTHRVAGHHGGGPCLRGEQVQGGVCRYSHDGRAPGQDPVGEAEPGRLLVHHEGDAAPGSSEPDRDRDVPAGRQHRVRPELPHRPARLLPPRPVLTSRAWACHEVRVAARQGPGRRGNVGDGFVGHGPAGSRLASARPVRGWTALCRRGGPRTEFPGWGTVSGNGRPFSRIREPVTLPCRQLICLLIRIPADSGASLSRTFKDENSLPEWPGGVTCKTASAGSLLVARAKLDSVPFARSEEPGTLLYEPG